MVNDFYETGGPAGAPLGNIQMLGRVSGEILAAQAIQALLSRPLRPEGR